MPEKIKKENRAFLYFRENGNGGLNIKFGPEQFTTDTKKFNEILMIGNLKCISFLSGLTAKENLEIRMAQYENIKLSFSAVFDQAFPDVFAEKKRIMLNEEEAFRKAEADEPLSESFLKEIEETKKKMREENQAKPKLVVTENNEKILKDIEDQVELFGKVYESVMENYNPKDVEEKDETGYKIILIGLVESKIDELKRLHFEISKDEKSE